MVTINEAFREAMKLTELPNVIGVGRTKDKIIIYATSKENIPSTILGFPVIIIITTPFKVL